METKTSNSLEVNILFIDLYIIILKTELVVQSINVMFVTLVNYNFFSIKDQSAITYFIKYIH